MSGAAHSALVAFAEPEDEVARLKVLDGYAILGTSPEPTFDHITAVAAALFTAPMAIIGFVGRDRVYFKSHHGLATTEVTRGPGGSSSALVPWLRQAFGKGFHADAPLRAPDGCELGKLCVIDPRGRAVDPQRTVFLGSLAAIVMDNLNIRLAARDAAARARLMAREIDHRATNSLALIAGLLQRQSRAIELPAAQQLRLAASRVLALAGVHQTFSSNEDAQRVAVVPYLRRLCEQLSEMFATNIEVEGPEVTVPNTQIRAIGLITNELVINATKYGRGPVTVALRSHHGRNHELCVCDEGGKLPDGFAPDNAANGIGMKIAIMLSEQLDGRIAAHSSADHHPSGRRTCFVVTFPAA